MKKNLSALMLCFFSIMSYGQIQFQKAPESRDVVRAIGMNSSVTIVELKGDSTTSYYIRTITTNRYDKTFLMSIGHNEEEVKASLDALLQMASANKGDSFTIDEDFSVSVVRKGLLYIKGRGYAGYAEMSKKQVEKLIKYYAEGGH